VRVEPNWLRLVGLPRLGAGPSGRDFVLAVSPRRLVLDWYLDGAVHRARVVEA
jgi:hypothetical protein